MADIDKKPVPISAEEARQREQNGEEQNAAMPSLLSVHNKAGNGAVNQAVQQGLSSGGRTLPVESRRRAESQLGRSLGDVRVYDDAAAALSAQLLDAQAYTVGRNIVLNGGVDLSASEGQHLLTHELVHTIQQENVEPDKAEITLGHAGDSFEQEASRLSARPAAGRPSLRTAGPMVQRIGAGEWLARFFGGGTFSEKELQDYLNFLRANRRIENGTFESDNKARAIVADWRKGGKTYDIEDPRIRALLIEEMISGFTGNDDENAILDILQYSDNRALFLILNSSGTTPPVIDEEFHGDEKDKLHEFFSKRLKGGLAAAKQSRVDPIGQPLLRGTDQPAKSDTTSSDQTEGLLGQCSLLHPENCAVYEDWLAHFNDPNLETFTARTHHTVIGKKAPLETAADPNAPQSKRRPPMLHEQAPYLPTDTFIDGPTEEWVRQNLPQNLVETAYQLRSDCADIAVILRHVWLSAHHRTETYRSWTVGSALGKSESSKIQQIIGAVTTKNLDRIVSPYRDENGAIIRDLPTLSRLLHPGDILVWDHLNTTTGHSHTIIDITRNKAGLITSMTALQGNLPIGRDHAEALREALPDAERKKAPSVSALRFAPGRRIERRVMGDFFLQTRHNVWAWDDADDSDTVLIAAGPPQMAPEPGSRKKKGHVRQLADWIPQIKSASNDRLIGLFEAALFEMRATLEGNQPVSEVDARAVGQAAGERLWTLAKGAADLGEDSHYRPLTLMRQTIRRLREGSLVKEAKTAFSQLDDAFRSAARGGQDINFNRAGQPEGTRVVKIMITGFDPFTSGPTPNAPPRGAWNPSGAAVLALDGQTIPAGPNRVAAVEGVVLPVSYDQFREGFAEELIRPYLATVDAVITLSLNPSLKPGDPLDLERYAVGVHKLNDGTVESVPADPNGGKPGPAIIETNAPIDEIAAATASPAQNNQPAVPKPVVDSAISLKFISVVQANAALNALNLPSQNGRSVTIEDQTAIKQIIQTMGRPSSPDIPGITFSAGGKSFAAEIERGPGGSFLSNEISYRTQRLLRQQGSKAQSFHVHTAGYNVIPQGQTTDEEKAKRKQAMTEAKGIRDNLIASLQRLLAAVAERV